MCPCCLASPHRLPSFYQDFRKARPEDPTCTGARVDRQTESKADKPTYGRVNNSIKKKSYKLPL